MTLDTFDDLVVEAEEIETRPDSRAIEETLLVGLLDQGLADLGAAVERHAPDGGVLSYGALRPRHVPADA